ncbi:hypothetical protein D3C81_1973340 [compost metagenome]
MLQGLKASSQRMQKAKPGARWPPRANDSTQISNATCRLGARMIARAATRAMKVMVPVLRIITASQSVAELLSPCMLMVITG